MAKNFKHTTHSTDGPLLPALCEAAVGCVVVILVLLAALVFS